VQLFGIQKLKGFGYTGVKFWDFPLYNSFTNVLRYTAQLCDDNLYSPQMVAEQQRKKNNN